MRGGTLKRIAAFLLNANPADPADAPPVEAVAEQPDDPGSEATWRSRSAIGDGQVDLRDLGGTL